MDTNENDDLIDRQLIKVWKSLKKKPNVIGKMVIIFTISNIKKSYMLKKIRTVMIPKTLMGNYKCK